MYGIWSRRKKAAPALGSDWRNNWLRVSRPKIGGSGSPTLLKPMMTRGYDIWLSVWNVFVLRCMPKIIGIAVLLTSVVEPNFFYFNALAPHFSLFRLQFRLKKIKIIGESKILTAKQNFGFEAVEQKSNLLIKASAPNIISSLPAPALPWQQCF